MQGSDVDSVVEREVADVADSDEDALPDFSRLSPVSIVMTMSRLPTEMTRGLDVVSVLDATN
ncbi:hypothetical protein L916_18888 [Phytophthora nicotianae]|uniref:Uncharacterized protein n=1 Tax=Phytophthora nicotianae TaxID=4792 RepID=W2I097_PHYNI|nr:hypothetical protein L916_18888 [Phytophthora nicotianae]